MKLYQTKDYLHVVDITRPRYDTWMYKKAIVPTKKPKRQGDRSGWSFEDMVQGIILKHLSESALLVEVAGNISKKVVKQGNGSVMVSLLAGVSITVDKAMFVNEAANRLNKWQG